jgi:maltooligosyltrehalose trehalohydrolase
VGAEVLPQGGVHFRVWAPRRRRVAVVLEGHTEVPLQSEEGGYFAGLVPTARAGSLYRFRLDDGERLYPDPASRFQPDGPHRPSQVIDPAAFRWTDDGWRGAAREGQVIYEMHLGTFTPRGTWDAAARELPELADLGITMIEVMPVADFPGRFGWGYDGVDLFAPCRLYGTPDDMRRFVDRAHALGVAVILDVVYNHFGPDGNYVREFTEHCFTDRHTTDWGEAINYDGADSGPVREFFTANAGYWIDEFHLDGLRLDATQTIYDDSADHILAAIGRRVREAARGRGAFVVAENEPQHVRLIRSANQGGYGLDALWNDDFHRTARVALTSRNDAYYGDYLGTPQEFISSLKWGHLFQGQRFRGHRKRRGTPALDQPPAALVNFIENHDQVSNSAHGLRVHQLTSPGRYRAVTALLLLAPQTPLLFQGQEFAASSPFHFFADHPKELAEAVRRGRARFLSQFRSLADPAMQARLPDPDDPKTFERCKLDLSERHTHAAAYALHRDLLKLRGTDPVFAQPRPRGLDGAVLGPHAFLLRYFAENGDGRLLLVNLGRDLHLDPAPEPLLAPPEGKQWAVLWSSENPRYGGNGTAPPETEEGWRIPGEAALVLVPGSAAGLRAVTSAAAADSVP